MGVGGGIATHHRIWIEHRGEHIAAVVTVPNGPIGGLVTLPVFALPEGVIGSHFYALLSQALVGHGLATVRFEYVGLGDSTGAVVDWSHSDVEQQLWQARAVTRATMDALGVTSFAVAGACYDAAIALRLANDPACTGAVCSGLPATAPNRVGLARRKFTHSSIASRIRRNPVLRKVLLYDFLRKVLRDRVPADVKQGLAKAQRVLLLGDTSAWGYDPMLEQSAQTFRRVGDADALLAQTADWLIAGFAADVPAPVSA